MPRRPTPGPTEAELEILRVLWDIAPATVRQVHAALRRSKPSASTTTLKLMQIMLDKGLLVRDASVRPQLYRPAVEREQAQRELVGGLIDRVFDGSTRDFVMQVLAARPASPDELAEIRRLIRQAEKREQEGRP